MKRFVGCRALVVLLLFAVASLAVGCAPSSRDRFDPKRQAKQQELLQWMQEDHR